MRITKLFILSVSFLKLNLSLAQQELALGVERQLLQSQNLNPAFQIPKNTFAISLPSIAYNFAHSGFAYNDLIQQRAEDDSLIFTADKAISKMAEQNYLFGNLNIPLVQASYRWDRVAVGFGLTDKSYLKVRYPKVLAELLWYGNEYFLGETIEIGPQLNLSKHREWISAMSFHNSAGLTFGFRLKYLRGLASVYTSSDEIFLRTDSSDYAISVQSDYRLSTSSLEKFGSLINPGDLDFSNSGMGLDLGLDFELNKKIKVGFSILDLGFIRWKQDVVNYSSNGLFEFNGVNVFNFNEESTFHIDDFLDSLNSSVGIKIDSSTYTSFQVPRSYLNFQFTPDSVWSFRAQFYTELIDGLIPAATLGICRDWFGKYEKLHLQTSLAWSYKNRSFLNFGSSLIFGFGNLEIFLLGDNLLSIFFPKSYLPLNLLGGSFQDSNSTIQLARMFRTYNLRFGVNLLFRTK